MKKAKKAQRLGNKSSTSKSLKAPKEADDIVELILMHHKPLKELIDVMKDSENKLYERQEAFEEFVPLLLAHAKPEEEVLYTFFKSNDQREAGFEGETEHALADQLIEELEATSDDDQWSAKVKVLAELVEHHIEEEEEEMLPDFKKNSTKVEREMLGQDYKDARTNYGDNQPRSAVYKKSEEARV